MGHSKLLGILAGAGELPVRAARNILSEGREFRYFYFTKEEPPEDIKPFARKVVLTKLFSSVIASMQKEKVKELLLLGKANRDILYDNPKFDLRSILFLAKMASQSDTNLFENLAKEFERRGISIIAQNLYLKDLFLPKGRYGKSLSTQELEDIEFGMHHVREINRLDVGQTVVIGKKSVLAIECAEGTDLCIQRGGNLFKKKGAVVCKTAKINHDLRFDIPAVGLSTLVSMKKSGCRVLAIEADKTFVVSPIGFLKEAQKLGITVVSMDPEKNSSKEMKKLNRMTAKYE